MTFDEKVQQAIQNKILKEINSADFTRLDHQQKVTIPDDVVSKVWADVDWKAVMKMIKPEMERRVCNAIIGNMEKEIKTDVKAIMSIDGVRQRLRVEVYPKIMEIVGSAQ